MAVLVVRFLLLVLCFMLQAAMDGHVPAAGPRHAQLLLDTGLVLMMLGVVILTHQLCTSAAAASSDAEFRLLALLLWLLGAALVMLALVARQFPRLAATGVAVAWAFCNYLVGGL